MTTTAESLRHDSDISDDYWVGDVLGAGTSGVVHKLVQKDTSIEYAGKLLDVSNTENLNDFNLEVTRLIEFASQSTIQVFATYFLEDKAWVSKICNIAVDAVIMLLNVYCRARG